MKDIEEEDKKKIADLREKYPSFSYEYLYDMFYVIRHHNRNTEKKKMKFAMRMIELQGLSIERGTEIAIHEARMNSDSFYDKAFTKLKEKVDKVGGLAISAHPYRGFLVFGFGSMQMDLEQAMANPTLPHVHALEVCNSMVTDEENETAKRVADEMGLLKVGGSDAHKPETMGTCVMVFESRLQDEAQLIEAVLAGRYTLERAK